MTAAKLADKLGAPRHTIREIAHALCPWSKAGGSGFDYTPWETEAITDEFNRRKDNTSKPTPEPEGMTSKQIAEAVGKPLRTVQDWIKSLSAKSALINAKSASSSPMHPAIYALAESCLIIEEGLGKAAADVYRTNAVNAAMAPAPKPAALSAALVRECRISVEHGILSRAQIAVLLGVPVEPAALAPLQIPAAIKPTTPPADPKLPAKYLERKRRFLYEMGSAVRVDEIAVTFGISVTKVREIASRFTTGEIATRGRVIEILAVIEKEIPL